MSNGPFLQAADTSQRDRIGAIIAWLAFALGVGWRIFYIGVAHRPDRHIYADMAYYADLALRINDPNNVQTIYDTIFPPGTAYLLAGAWRLSNDWSAAILIWLTLSCITPLLIYVTAKRLGGWRVAHICLIFASLWFQFIDYGGFFLAETPFIACLAGGFALTAFALTASNRWIFLASAAGAAACLVLSATFKSQSLATCAIWIIMIVACCPRILFRQMAWGLTIVLSVSMLLLIPVATRTSSLAGGFHLVSTNGSLNMLIGHYQPDIAVLKFTDPVTGFYYVTANPTTLQKGNTGEHDFNFGAFDGRKCQAAAWQWIRDNPLQSTILSIDHVIDLYAGGTYPWPNTNTPYRDWMNLWEKFNLLCICLPALLYVHNASRSAFSQRKLPPFDDILCISAIMLLWATVFMTMGEPRYRIPYDLFSFYLAAKWYAGIGSQTTVSDVTDETAPLPTTKPLSLAASDTPHGNS